MINDNRRVPILDHGYVETVDFWGSDEAIIEAARMSTNKGFTGWGPLCDKCGAADTMLLADERGLGLPCVEADCTGKLTKPGDEKLLAYLWKNKHHTPFEMAGAKFEIKAPIFVFREWHRHRTQSYNEMSARYTPLPNENYLPDIHVLFDRATVGAAEKNKQAQSKADVEYVVDAEDRKQQLSAWLESLDEVYEHAQSVYSRGLEIGVPKELARLPVPVARYSRMQACANLRNWLGFLALRVEKSAQWEIRQYAEVVQQMLAEGFPRTLELFSEGREK